MKNQTYSSVSIVIRHLQQNVGWHSILMWFTIPAKFDAPGVTSGHSGKKYKCDICGKEYPRKEHVECDYKATVMANLNTHIKSKHEGKRSQCSQCDYNAFDKQTLQKHVNAIHLNIKPFQCDRCDFKATHKWNVNSHVKRNHKNWRYKVNETFWNPWKNIPFRFRVKAIWARRLVFFWKSLPDPTVYIHPPFRSQ